MTDLQQSTPKAGAESRWAGLDHIRALAAFMVFTWHFTHGANASPVPLEGAPTFPFAALFDEGHAGVALFMCLSGYLFAALLDGKEIHFPKFIIARVLRLAPLLVFLFVVDFVILLATGGSVIGFVRNLISGFVLPRWPNGRWSIGIELQFYLLLPFLLGVRGRFPMALPLMVVGALLMRAALFIYFGTVEHWAYSTLIGRIDQFILGIAIFDYRLFFKGRHGLAAATASILGIAYYLFDAAGGFFGYKSWPSQESLWIWWPTFEAITFAILIAYYATTFSPRGRFSDALSKVGFYSYGIYLIHFYFVFAAAEWINSSLIALDNFYVAWAVSLPVFLAMVAPAWAAYHIIEKPLQKYKPRYVLARPITKPAMDSSVFPVADAQ